MYSTTIADLYLIIHGSLFYIKSSQTIFFQTLHNKLEYKHSTSLTGSSRDFTPNPEKGFISRTADLTASGQTEAWSPNRSKTVTPRLVTR